MKKISEEHSLVGETGAHTLLPVLLKIEELNVLLVGAGNSGLEKLHAILHHAPATNISIVTRQISNPVKELSRTHSNLLLIERAFEPDDLDNRDIVIITVSDKTERDYIYQLAKQRNLLVHVSDSRKKSDFHFDTIVHKKNPNIRIAKAVTEKEQVGAAIKWRRIASYSLIGFALMLIGHFIFSYLPLKEVFDSTSTWYKTLDKNFHWMVLAGFLAQLVDGATSMGYGVTSAVVLMSANVSPAAMSGSIHTAEMFASGASGYSHYRFGNVNKKLFKTLLIPGIIGAVLGAILLVKLGDTHISYVRPIMAAYTLFLGVKIFITAFRAQKIQKKYKRHGWLAGLGGFLDSFGGGGWGPIVTTTLVMRGRNPKYVIGSVSLTEFFVTLASAFTFFTLIGVSHWQVILALVIGGLLAAPIAAKLTGKLPRKPSFILLGVIVTLWSVRILVKALANI